MFGAATAHKVSPDLFQFSAEGYRVHDPPLKLCVVVTSWQRSGCNDDKR